MFAYMFRLRKMPPSESSVILGSHRLLLTQSETVSYLGTYIHNFQVDNRICVGVLIIRYSDMNACKQFIASL